MAEAWVLIRVVAFVLLLKFTAGLLSSMVIPKPPLSIRVVGNLEFAFGTCMVLPSVTVLLTTSVPDLQRPSVLLAGGFLALGIGWDVVAISLLKGKFWARQVCLALSIVRILTLVGIPFSIVALYVLCRNRSAEYFFRENRGRCVV